MERLNFARNMTAREATDIAVWHADKAEHSAAPRDKQRHEVISFRLFKLAHEIRATLHHRNAA